MLGDGLRPRLYVEPVGQGDSDKPRDYRYSTVEPDPHTTVRADTERLLTSPSLPPKVSVSGHVYDIATGHVTTTHDARYP